MTSLPPWVTRVCNNAAVRMVALVIYYLAIILGLILLYGKGDFSTPSFIYQGF
jgi:hypothetical protein